MTDKEPTQEEIKKLWEWCGFTLNNETKRWYLGNSYYSFGDNLPDIDLNNLFKYAKQPFTKKYGVGQWTNLLHRWVDILFSNPESDPAAALFWVILEVIK